MTPTRTGLLEVGLAGSIFVASITLTLVAGWEHFSVIAVADAQSPQASLGMFLAILGTNMLAMLGLFSGVVTLGLGSFIFSALVGMMLGWSIGVSVALHGVSGVLARSWAYTPLEVSGFILAAAAGFIPVTTHLRGASRDGSSLGRSLRVLAIATGLLVLAAVVEVGSIKLYYG